MKPVADALQVVPVTVRRHGEVRQRADCVVEEVPVALVFNGVSHAVMMATPSDLEAFALGFALTEGLLAGPEELYGVDIEPVADGIELRLQVAAGAAWRLAERRRTLAGRTGCGLCGTDSLAQVRQALPQVPAVRLEPGAIRTALAALDERQELRGLTGGTHAAAWCSRAGEVRLVREDVGRHNALDKLVGALVRSRADRADGFVVITSRASFEMVQKTAMAGIGALVAVSAPTPAIEVATGCGIALAGFARGDDAVAYSHAGRLGLAAALPAVPPEPAPVR